MFGADVEAFGLTWEMSKAYQRQAGTTASHHWVLNVVYNKVVAG